MEQEQINILFELMQNCSYLVKLLINIEIAMNDAEIELCQKYTKEVQNQLAMMNKDVFEEYFESFDVDKEIASAYDIPNTLELAKILSILVYNCSIILGLANENQEQGLLANISNQIAQNITAIKEIYQQIYNN